FRDGGVYAPARRAGLEEALRVGVQVRAFEEDLYGPTRVAGEGRDRHRVVDRGTQIDRLETGPVAILDLRSVHAPGDAVRRVLVAAGDAAVGEASQKLDRGRVSRCVRHTHAGVFGIALVRVEIERVLQALARGRVGSIFQREAHARSARQT